MNKSKTISPPADPADSEAAPPDIPEGFAVRDEKSANWVVRKIVEGRAYASHVHTWAAAEIRRAENDERFFLERFGRQLEAWAREFLIQTRSRRRSVPLPSGTIGFRSVGPHLLITDEGKLLVWCREHLLDAVSVEVRATGADALRLKEWLLTNCPDLQVAESTIKSIIDEQFRQMGECPAGTECTAGEKFFIK